MWQVFKRGTKIENKAQPEAVGQTFRAKLALTATVVG